MRLSRREFLKLAGAVGIASTLPIVTLEKALAGNGDPRVIWLQGQSCSGCSVSLMNCIETVTVDKLLTDHINLEYHSTLIAAAGDLALSGAFGPHPSLNELASFSDQWLAENPDPNDYDISGPAGLPDNKINLIDYAALCNQGYILVVEGAIPMGSEGVFCDIGGHMTMKDAFDTLAQNADAILAVGACACYGGIPGAPGNPTEALSATEAMDQLGIANSAGVVKIPGCPMHPEWFVDTVVKLLAGESVSLDTKHRPAFLFGDANSERIHNSCPLKGTGQAIHLGDTGCKRDLGCRGEFTWGKCPSQKWNNGVSWCIQTQSTCTGCTEPDYPGAEPFFERYTPPTS